MADLIDRSSLVDAAEYIQNKQYQRAQKILYSYLKKHQNSEEAWFLLSYALDDPQKKAYSLKKVLEINPENLRARNRLSKVEKILSVGGKGQPTPNQKKNGIFHKSERQIHWMTYPIAILILLFISFIMINNIFPSFSDRTSTPSEQSLSGFPTETWTISPKPTEEPTSLPSITPSTEVTPTPESTFVPTISSYDLSLPQGSLAKQMDDIQNQVATLRGLGIKYDNPRYLISQEKVYNIINDVFRKTIRREDLKKQAIALQALGLIDPTYDYYSHMVERINEGIGGFYLPITDEIFVIGEDFNGIGKFVFAHEYNHSLIDQHYNLLDMGPYPICGPEIDSCAAILGLIEGDATFLMYRWLEAYATEEDISSIEQAQYTPSDFAISKKNIPPPYLIRDASFKYLDGKRFVEFLYDNGGWSSVDQAYQMLPDTSEQVLHPEKYVKNESAIQVKLSPIDHFLGDNWELQVTATLGELMTDMILGYSENYLAQLDPTVSANAASGWGGDRFQVYYQNKSNHNLLVAMWEWDTINDRNEFWDAISEYLNLYYLGKQIQETEDTCWTKINDHFSCIYKWNRQTLWIKAPTMSLISQILAEYPNFK